MGFSNSVQKPANPKNPNPKNAQKSGSDDCCGRGHCTEEQLEEILLKNLDFLYNEAVSELVELGYDEDVALKAILREGYWYGEGSMDVLTNVLRNSLTYLNGGCCESDGDSEGSVVGFANLRQLEEESLKSMICLLQKLRPKLSRGDSLWCLLMSDLNVGRASTLEIPGLRPPSNVCRSKCKSKSGIESVSVNINVTGELCKCHGHWGFGSGAKSKLPVDGFGGVFSFSESSIERDNGCPKRLNLSPAMKSLLKRNLAAFASGFRSKQQTCISSAATADSSEGTALAAANAPPESSKECRDNNLDFVNSVLNKLRDLNLDDNLDSVAEDQKDELILTLLDQVKDLEKQVKERKEWAHQTALQAAKRLSTDLTELKTLRTEREETQRLKKGKQTLEDSTMKRLSEMETALRKASSQVDRANAGVRRLEVENAEIRAEMEASKLSASESMKASLEIAKREKKCLKRLLNWEKQKTKLQEEIAAEKKKISDLQKQMVQINAAQKESEAKWRHEVKEKEVAMAQVEEERRSKETTEGNNKRKLEALRLRIEIDFQRHKDDLRRLEQEFSRLNSTSLSTNPENPLDAFNAGRNPGAGYIARHLGKPEGPEKESGSERECLVCKKDEVSVVFLPCAHQVMCSKCGEHYGKKGKKATCPCCRVPIEQRIRVFGASS